MLPAFPAWPEAERSKAEYRAFFPNRLLALQVDHGYAVILLPAAEDRTLETMRIFYVGDAPLAESFKAARDNLREGWRKVFAEDVSVVEGVQSGRASTAFDGGVFSSVIAAPTHHFHQWMAARLP